MPANTTVTFELRGEGFNVAMPLPRLLTLKNPSVVYQSAGVMRVRGITPSCGYIDVALTDHDDGDEFPYRKATGLQAVLAGHICGTSLVQTRIGGEVICATGTHWDDATKSCKNED